MTSRLTDKLGVPPRLMALGILAIAASTQPVFLAGAAIGSMGEELGYGPGLLGVLTAAFFVTAGFFSAPLGALVERLGWQRALRINSIDAGLILLLMSFGVRNIPTLVVFLMLAAVNYGLANPAANAGRARRVIPDALQGLQRRRFEVTLIETQPHDQVDALTHDPERMLTLCWDHHRVRHLGLLRIEGSAPDFRFLCLLARSPRRPADFASEAAAAPAVLSFDVAEPTPRRARWGRLPERPC